MPDAGQTVSAPVAKIVSAWTAAAAGHGIEGDVAQQASPDGALHGTLNVLGIGGWADFASFVAAVYTTVLLCEWAWKKWRKMRASKNEAKADT